MKHPVALASVWLWWLLTTGVSQASVEVDIEGVDGELRDNVKAFLSIGQKSVFERFDRDFTSDKVRSAPEVERLHERAHTEIQDALQPFGYYRPEIRSRLDWIDNQWRAEYRIERGPRVQLENVTLTTTGDGRGIEALEAPARAIRKLAGRGLHHGRYEDAKRALAQAAYQAGYLDAHFEDAELLVDPERGAADARLTFNTGPIYRFGDVTIEQDVLRPDFVGRYHDIETGDPFDTNRLIELQLKLNATSYFDGVEVDVQRDLAVDNRIPVVVRTQPRNRYRYRAGAGFGTDTGPRVRAGIESRRVNRRGHTYRVDARASAITTELQAEYHIPIKDVTQDRWRIYTRAEKSEVGDADITQYLVGAAREDAWGPLRRRLFVNAERESFGFGDESKRSSALVYPGIALSYSALDDARFVRRGISVSASAWGGMSELGSEVDFATVRLNGRVVLPLAKRMRLLSSVDIGRVTTSRFRDLPPSQRFFAGGDRSVRGYGYQSISPENEDGDDIGGAYLTAGSVEVDYRVSNAWAVAGFLDAGEASADFPTDFKLGVGLGVRYLSPVGMIRLDLAHPLDDPDTAVRLHVSIGPDL